MKVKEFFQGPLVASGNLMMHMTYMWISLYLGLWSRYYDPSLNDIPHLN